MTGHRVMKISKDRSRGNSQCPKKIVLFNQRLANIKVFNDYDVLMDHCCSIFNDAMFECRRAGTAKMALSKRSPF